MEFMKVDEVDELDATHGRETLGVRRRQRSGRNGFDTHVLGCIEAEFSNHNLILQHFDRIEKPYEHEKP